MFTIMPTSPFNRSIMFNVHSIETEQVLRESASTAATLRYSALLVRVILIGKVITTSITMIFTVPLTVIQFIYYTYYT